MAVKSMYDVLMTSRDRTAAKRSGPQADPGAASKGQADAGQPDTEQAGTERVSRQREAGEATRRETRRRLLAAAQSEFSERGYVAATVARIASRAGVSVQSLQRLGQQAEPAARGHGGRRDR